MTTTGGDHSDVRRDGERTAIDRSLLVELAHGRLSADESRELLDRVAADEELSAELDLVILMMGEGAREERETRYEPGKEQGRTLRESAGPALVVLRVAATLLLMFGAGRLIDAALAPAYADLAQVEAADLHLRIRDGATDEVAAMRAYLYQGDWEEAVRRADWFLSVHPDATGRQSVFVIRSAAMLMGARKAVMGFGMHYDAALVDSAMVSLANAREGQPSSVEMEQIAWFEAKAFLMKGDPGEASVRLRSIVEAGGICVQDARRILADLDARHPGPQ
ncbi:MAG: hypothetical protein IPI01_02290 [Ignavibacteriae bacterium]|nr:hypothetical protein [Ignavibacteriota bacterium]